MICIMGFHLLGSRNYYSLVSGCSFLQYFIGTCSVFFLWWTSQWKVLCQVNNIHMAVYYFVLLLISLELRVFCFALMQNPSACSLTGKEKEMFSLAQHMLYKKYTRTPISFVPFSAARSRFSEKPLSLCWVEFKSKHSLCMPAVTAVRKKKIPVYGLFCT